MSAAITDPKEQKRIIRTNKKWVKDNASRLEKDGRFDETKLRHRISQNGVFNQVLWIEGIGKDSFMVQLKLGYELPVLTISAWQSSPETISILQSAIKIAQLFASDWIELLENEGL